MDVMFVHESFDFHPMLVVMLWMLALAADIPFV